MIWKYKLVLIVSICFFSCEELTIFEPPIEPPVTEDPDFTRLEYRIGYWLNTEGSDTIQFVNDSIYISRSPNYNPQILEYFIEADTFYDRIHGQSWWLKRSMSFDQEEEIVSFLTNSTVPNLPPVNIPYKKI